ncbi:MULTISPECIES: hypothetical protein [unclassified Rhizobium]|uniref:hypothetical protein n=1 Tax=unclassified Rhizobium TaxID=2613769 RepID=UPI001FD73C53|nr:MULTISPECIES: hypothetical protein [unclassified Rhizobium]
MFAMKLALGLHAEGLGTCMLNWSAARDQDQMLRRNFRQRGGYHLDWIWPYACGFQGASIPAQPCR